MKLKIKMYFDYVCPFCNLAKYPFEEAIAGKEVEVEYMPYEVAPFGEEPLDPVKDEEKSLMWKNEVFPLIKKLNIDMKLPNISPHPYTTLTFEGYHFACEHNKSCEYNEKVFSYFYKEEKNIGDIDVLVSIAKKIGLDEEEFRYALENRTYKDKQCDACQCAYNQTFIEMVPTFVIGETILCGVKTKEEYEAIIMDEINKLNKNI